MRLHLIPHAPPYTIVWPDNPVSIIGIFIICVILTLSMRAEIRRGGRRVRVNWPTVTVLAVMGILFNIFIGVSISQTDFLLTAGINEWDGHNIFMLFSALPWMLAGGLFGGIPGLIVGFLSGAARAFFISHNIFTPLEDALLAVLFAWLVKQPYRTAFYRATRHPIIAAAVLSLGAVGIHVFGLLLTGNGSLFLRLDQVFSAYPTFIIILGVELLLAGFLSEGIFKLVPSDLLAPEYLTPSPGERNLQNRFVFNIAPWILILFILSALSSWHTSESGVLKRQVGRLELISDNLAISIQSFIQSDSDGIKQISADQRLFYQDEGEIAQALQEDQNNTELFDQLILVDRDLHVIASYPKLDYQQGEPEGLEAEEITRSFQDGQLRMASLPALRDGRSAQISFIQPLQGENASPVRMLIGRAEFTDNPQGQVLLTALDGSQSSGMLVELVDENGNVIFHPSASQLMTKYIETPPEYDGLYQSVSTDGSRLWIYYQAVAPTGWGIYVLTPGWVIQQEVLHIAGLILLLSFGIILLISAVVWLSLGNTSKSIGRLIMDAEKIAGGQLAVPIRPVKESDEIGQLSQAFEKMRVALKTRMDELSSLVAVSQGVASSLAIREAVMPILDAALGDNASAARIIIENDGAGDSDQVSRFGAGPSSETYAYLDDQISELTREHGSLVINNLQRGRTLTSPPEKTPPGALIAIPLMSEDEEHGTFWVAYDNPRNFSDEEVRFFKTLAGETILASTNARLYDSAALGRQRLEAVLAATPDPVLVIDQKARLILFNPAARDLVGPQETTPVGKLIREVFQQEDLRKLLTAVGDDQISKEIQYPDGRVFYATVSPVVLQGKQVGKACLLRDVTRFKELDLLKTEFVATVSHDLRSPLLTARGYASMLAMVGEMNDQQKNYLQKILDGIDNMSDLVNNLLDPDRLKGGKSLKLQTIQIGTLIKGVIESLRHQAVLKKIELLVDLGSNDTKEIEADPALLERAVYNLVENAIKYAPVSGHVSLTLLYNRASVIFKVCDNGNGIAPLDLPHIFDRPPFEDGGLDSSKTSWGLSIVKTIAERHGGRVWVESQLGQGSTFSLELPVSEENK